MTTHKYRNVRVVYQVITDTTQQSSSEFTVTPTSGDNHGCVQLLGYIDYSLSGLAGVSTSDASINLLARKRTKEISRHLSQM